MKKEPKLKASRSFSPPKKLPAPIQETEEPDSNRTKQYFTDFNDKTKLKFHHQISSSQDFFCDDQFMYIFKFKKSENLCHLSVLFVVLQHCKCQHVAQSAVLLL